MVTSLPNFDFCGLLNKKLYNFLWDGKPDKVKRSIITQSKVDGGLKMPEVKKFIKSLKCTWVKRFVTSYSNPWAKLF